MSRSSRNDSRSLQHQHRQPTQPLHPIRPVAVSVPAFPTASYRTVLTDLSAELLLVVLRFLDTRTFLRCCRVHRDLRAVSVSDDVSCWEYAHFQPRQCDAFLSSLPSFYYLKSLDLSLLLTLTDAQLHSILLYCSRLTAIDLSCCWTLSNRAFLSLSRLLGGRLRSISFPRYSTQRLDAVAVSFPCMSHVGLTSIDLYGCSWLSQDNLIHLNSLNQLHTLRLFHMRHLGPSCLSFLRGNALSKLKRWPALSTLSLCGCVGVNDETLASIALLPRLRTLDVSGCWRVSDAGVRLLSAEGSLCRQSVEELLLEGCSALARPFGESVLHSLQSMPALAALQLPRCGSPDSLSVEQHLLAQLLSTSRLSKLELTEWSVTEDDLVRASEPASAALRSFTLRATTLRRSLSFLNTASFAPLTSLALDSVDVHDWDERQPGLRLTSLLHLSVKRSPQAHRMLPLFVQHAPLLSLDVSFCPSMDDRSWAVLAAHCRSLGTLHAQATPVSQTGLVTLSALPHLHTLDLFQSPLPAAALSLFTLATSFPALSTLCLTVERWHGWQQWKQAVAAAHTDVLISEEVEKAGRLEGEEEDEENEDEDESDEEWQPAASDSEDWREEADDEQQEERMETELRSGEEQSRLEEDKKDMAEQDRPPASAAGLSMDGIDRQWLPR